MFLSIQTFAQITLFSDLFAWTNQNPLERTGWIPDGTGSPWQLQTDYSSSGYTGASGGANAYTDIGWNTEMKSLTFSNNLNTEIYQNIILKFGARGEGAIPNLFITYSTDGVTYNPFTGNSVTLGIWAQHIITLPAEASCSNLRIRFQIQGTGVVGNNIRIDDVYITGVLVPPGKCITFDDTDDRGVVPANALFETQSFTAEAWINTTAANTNVILSCNDYTNKDGWDLRLLDGKMAASLCHTTGWITPYSPDIKLNDGKWHHVAITMDAVGNFIYYADGNIVYTSSLPNYVKPSGNDFILGIHNNLEAWSAYGGKIDEVRVWNVARMQSEIQTDMVHPINPSTPGLVAYYNLDEDVSFGSFYDMTSNDLHGTLTNFTFGTFWFESYAMVVPEMQAPSNIGTSGFTASWTAPETGTFDKFLLDVSPFSDFSAFVSGYEGLDCGTNLSQNITGLLGGTTYYARVRAYKTSEGDVGGYSSTSITTLDCAYSLNFTSTPTSCYTAFDGTATVTPSVGGTYIYQWHDAQTTQTATGFPISDVYVTVTDDQSCSKAGYTTITGPALINDYPVIGGSYCDGTPGTNVNLLGSQTGVTYQLRINGIDFGPAIPGTGAPLLWNNVTTPTNPGTATVFATQSPGCTYLMASSSIIDILSLSTITGAITPVDCKGNATGAIDITVTGTDPHTFLWSNNDNTEDISGLLPNSYYVTVTNGNNCSSIYSGEVTEPAEVLSLITSHVDESCFLFYNGSATATPSGGTTPYNYYWTGGVTTPTITGITYGYYYFTVTDARGCTKDGLEIVSGPEDVQLFNVTGGGSYCDGGQGVSVMMSGSQLNVNYQLMVNGANFGALVIGTGTPLAWNNITTTNSFSFIDVLAIQTPSNCTRYMNSSASVVNNANPVVTLNSVTNVSCFNGNNGAIDINVSGNSPFTYLWTYGFTTEDLSGLEDGTYSVTVKDVNNCQSTINQEITQPASTLYVTITSEDVTCSYISDGTATANPFGGTTPYYYHWNNNEETQTITDLSIFQNVQVTVTDANGCTAFNDKGISGPAPIISYNLWSPVFYCEGINGINVTLGGSQTGVSYQLKVDGINFGIPIEGTNSELNWLNVSSPDGNADITVFATQTASGCTSSNFGPTNAIEREAPVANLVSSNNVSCIGANDGTINISVTGGTPNYSFYWSNEATTEDISDLAFGNYSLTVSDYYNCTGTFSHEIFDATAISATASVNQPSCNGQTGYIHVDATGGTGTLLYSKDGVNFQASPNFVTAIEGNYVITVKDENLCIVQTNSVTLTQPLAIIATVVVDNPLCNTGTGTITVNATGGSGGLNFNINGGTFSTNHIFTGLAGGDYTLEIRDWNLCSLIKLATITIPAELTASATPNNPSCSTEYGSIEVTATGGTGTLNYSIDGTNYQTSNVLGGLVTGDYTLYVKDNNNCVVTTTASILIPSAILVNATVTNPLCSNGFGSIGITASGGTGTLTYSINGTDYQASNTFNNLVSGPYTLYVKDANECVAVETTEVVIPAPINGNAMTTDPMCHNGTGSIYVNASGGTGTLTFSIDGTNFQPMSFFSNLAPAIYIITVKDNNGCFITLNTTINNPAAIIASATPENPLCSTEYGSIVVTATGGTGTLNYSIDGTNYQISNVFGGLVTGDYTLYVKDNNNCVVTTTASILIPSAILVNATVTNPLCSNGFGSIGITASGGTGTLTYSINGTDYQASNTFNNLVSGPYTLYVKDANECVAVETTEVVIPAPINGNAMTTDPMCHNGTGSIYVNASGGTGTLTFSIDGTNFQPMSFFSNLAPAIYIITVKDNNACFITLNTTINNPAEIIISSLNVTDVSVAGGNDGQIDVSASGGTGALQYSINATDFFTSGIFTDLSSGTYAITVKDNSNCTITANATVNEPSPIEITVNSVIHVSCNNAANGVISVTAEGGISPYLYSINNGEWQTTGIFIGLAGGSYNVSAKDYNNATKTIVVIVNEPTLLSVDATPMNPSCSGGLGSINVSANGGTYPYQFSLDGNSYQQNIMFSDLAAGNYMVYVKDFNACVKTTTTSIVVPNPIIVSAVTNNPLCFGGTGTITANASGGVGGFTYSINGTDYQTQNLFTGLTTNTYTVYAKDANGCIAQTQASVVIPSEITVESVVTNVTCFGDNNGSVTFNATGGTGTLTYTPAQNLTNLSGGIYSVTVSDANGCSVSAQAEVTEPYQMFVYAGYEQTINQGESVQLGGTGNPTYAYSWTPASSLNDAFVSNPIATPQLTTTYFVTATYNGCTATNNVTINVIATYNISGVITYDNAAQSPMNNTTVLLIQNGTTIDNTVTDENGAYLFENKLNGNYTIQAVTTKLWGGGNATDAQLVQLHYTGNAVLTQPRVGAADVNASNSVNSTDALFIKRRFASLDNSFASGDWYFYPLSVTIADAHVTMDFKAVCFGDVDGSFTPSIAKLAGSVNLTTTETLQVEAGGIVDLPVRVATAMQPGAISLVFTYPQDQLTVLSVEAVAPGMSGIISNIANGNIYIAWNSLQALNLQSNDILLNIRVQMNTVNNNVLEFGLSAQSEIADVNAQVINNAELTMPAVQLLDATSVNETLVSNISLSVFPNPVTENSVLNYVLPETGNVTISVYDMNGKIVSQFVLQNQFAGTYTYILNAANLAEGTYHIRFMLESATNMYSARKTFVQVK